MCSAVAAIVVITIPAAVIAVAHKRLRAVATGGQANLLQDQIGRHQIGRPIRVVEWQRGVIDQIFQHRAVGLVVLRKMQGVFAIFDVRIDCILRALEDHLRRHDLWRARAKQLFFSPVPVQHRGIDDVLIDKRSRNTRESVGLLRADLRGELFGLETLREFREIVLRKLRDSVRFHAPMLGVEMRQGFQIEIALMLVPFGLELVGAGVQSLRRFLVAILGRKVLEHLLDVVGLCEANDLRHDLGVQPVMEFGDILGVSRQHLDHARIGEVLRLEVLRVPARSGRRVVIRLVGVRGPTGLFVAEVDIDLVGDGAIAVVLDELITEIVLNFFGLPFRWNVFPKPSAIIHHVVDEECGLQCFEELRKNLAELLLLEGCSILSHSIVVLLGVRAAQDHVVEAFLRQQSRKFVDVAWLLDEAGQRLDGSLFEVFRREHAGIDALAAIDRHAQKGEELFVEDLEGFRVLAKIGVQRDRPIFLVHELRVRAVEMPLRAAVFLTVAQNVERRC